MQLEVSTSWARFRNGQIRLGRILTREETESGSIAVFSLSIRNFRRRRYAADTGDDPLTRSLLAILAEIT
jgi:hypothetical protein